MEKSHFENERFALTGKEVNAWAFGFFWAGALLVGCVFTSAEAVGAAFEHLLGDRENLGVWVGAGAATVWLATMLINGWIAWSFAKPRLVNWFEERMIPADSIVDQDDATRVTYLATTQVLVDLEAGEESQETSGQELPEEGDPASVGPFG